MSSNNDFVNVSGVSVDGLVGVTLDNVLLHNSIDSATSEDGLYAEDAETDLCLH